MAQASQHIREKSVEAVMETGRFRTIMSRAPINLLYTGTAMDNGWDLHGAKV